MISQVRTAIADTIWISSVLRHRSRLGWRDAPKYSAYHNKARRTVHIGSHDPDMVSAAERFRHNGWVTIGKAQPQDLARSMWDKIRAEEAQGLPIWDEAGRYVHEDIYRHFPEVEALFKGEVGDFLQAIYGSNFKIFAGVCYRSKNDPSGPSGSQLWHADGGPGTCINLMWCLSPVSTDNGAMECLPWESTASIFKRERKHIRAKLQAMRSDTGPDARTNRRLVLCEYYLREIERGFRDKVVQPQ